MTITDRSPNNNSKECNLLAGASLNLAGHFKQTTALLMVIALSACSDSGISQTDVPQLQSAMESEQSNNNSEPDVEQTQSPVESEQSINSPDPDVVITGASEMPVDNQLQQSLLRNALYEDYAQRAQNEYSGVQQELPQSLASSGVLLNSLLVGMAPDSAKTHRSNLTAEHWAFQPWERLRKLPLLGTSPYNIRNSLAQGQIDCRSDGTGGYMIVSSEKIIEPINVVNPEFNEKIAESYYHFNIEYHNCQVTDDQPIFNGQVEAYFSVRKLYFDDRNYFDGVVYAFDHLLITYDNQTVSILGATSIEDGNDCGSNGDINHSVLTHHHETGTQVLMNDLSFGWHHKNGHEDGINVADACWQKTAGPSYIEGEFLHSDYGLVNISSPEDSADDQLYTAWRDYPNIDIQNQFGTAKFQAHQSDDSYNPYWNNWTTFSYLVAGSDIAEQVQQQQINFVKGGYSDLADSDSDGMTNSWELLFDLNPNDATDADIDLDRDRVINRIEHDTRGDPHRNDTSGTSGDATLALVLRSEAWDNRIRLDVSKFIPATLSEYYADTDNTLIIEVGTQGEWQQVPEHCSLDTNNRLLCNAWYVDPNLLAYLYFSPNEGGTVEVTATLELSNLDYWPDNNVMTQNVDF